MARKERKIIGPVEFTDMAYGGEAVGRHEGMVVFASLATVGDVANVDVTITRKSFARGRIVELLKPSELRTTPPCPYFGTCGGCQWQHIRYGEQLGFKRHLVAEAFQRIGHLDAQVQPTLGMEEPWHYRNTMEFGFTLEGEPGLRRLRGHRIVPIGECLISRREINEVLHALWRAFARARAEADGGAAGDKPLPYETAGERRGAAGDKPLPYETGKLGEGAQSEEDRPLPQGDAGVVRDVSASFQGVLPHNAFMRVGDRGPTALVGLLGHGDWPEIAERMVREHPDLISGVVQRKGRASPKGRTLLGNDYTEHQLLDQWYRAGLASFFQVNRGQTEVLIQTALSFLQPRPEDVILDAYSGVGTFSLQLSGKVCRIVAVESSPSANQDARINAAGLVNIELVEGNFGEVPLPVEQVDGVIIDPPRGGVSPEGLNALINLSPERVAYVSCDPTALARDAALLVGAGYRLERVQPVDLFPQTYHVETVALFLR